jgi:hypothetical protein
MDVLLPEPQLGRARTALLDADFVEREDDRVDRDHHHLPGLFSPRGEILIELHRTLFDAECPFRLDIRDLLVRARPTTILGCTVRELAPEDALIHACAHLSYGHRYSRYPLRSLADVMVIARSGLIDWRVVVGRTRQTRADGAVYWPLVLARIWLGAPIPDAVLRALAPGRAQRRLIGAVMRTGYILDRTRTPDDGTTVLFDLLLNVSVYSGCSARYQLAVILRSLFPPPKAVSHLSEHMRASPLKYGLTLARVGRFRRGLDALSKLVVSASRDS